MPFMKEEMSHSDEVKNVTINIEIRFNKSLEDIKKDMKKYSLEDTRIK